MPVWRKVSFLLILLVLMSPFPGRGQQQRTFIIGVDESIQAFQMDSLHFAPLLEIEPIKIFEMNPERSFKQEASSFSCKTVALAQPMDSVFRLIAKVGRRLQAGALQITFSDTCDIRVLVRPEVKWHVLPVKELNLFLSEKIIQDELYIELNMFDLSREKNTDLFQILLFENLFQHFLQEKIARGRVFSRPVLTSLIEDFRPVYEPELHFYIDAKAASALIKKWPDMKQAFKRRLFSPSFADQVAAFEQKLSLLWNSDYNRLVAMTKLLARYGNVFPLKKMDLSTNSENINTLRQNMLKMTDALLVFWFKPGRLNQEMIESLKKEIGHQDLLIF